MVISCVVTLDALKHFAMMGNTNSSMRQHMVWLSMKLSVLVMPPQQEDDMYNYQVSLLEYGRIVKNFYDAVSEGDGELEIYAPELKSRW